MIWLFAQKKNISIDKIPQEYINHYLELFFDDPFKFDAEVGLLTAEWEALSQEDISGLTSSDIVMNLHFLGVRKFFPTEGRVNRFYKEMTSVY